MGLEQDFPVPEHAVPRLRVSAQRLAEWKEVAQDEIMRALSNRHSWYNAFKDRVREGFDMIADKPNLKAFVRPVPNTPDKDILIRSTLEGISLDDLVAGFYCETTYDVRCAFAHMYEANFLDGGILQAHETRTEEDPMHFVGMRWIAFRSPAPAIVTSRDFLFFSYEGTAYDVDGNRVLFRFLRTMPMDDISIEDGHLPPLVRGKISNLHLYRQNGSHVDGFTKAMHSNAGNMPSWIVTKTISFMFPGITNVETVGDARALLAVGMAKLNPGRVTHSSGSSGHSGRYSGSSAVAHVAALASTNACGVCFHKFKMTRSKRRCQGCCREVCKRCTRRLFFFDELKQISDTGVVALRFCLNCMRQARGEVRENAAAAASIRSSLHRRRSSESATSSGSGRRHGHHQIVRRVPSQPEAEPYNDFHSTGNSAYDLDDDSDNESISYNGYNPNGLLTTSAAKFHQRSAQPLDPVQIQQLQQLQQQRQFSQKDHEDFIRLYEQYTNPGKPQKIISVDQLASRGNAVYGPPPPAPSPQLMQQQQQQVPRPFRRQNSGGGVSWTHSGNTSQRQSTQNAMHTMPDMPRHMIPPMPQPDGPSRSHIIPLESTTRHQSAPNLHKYDGSHSIRPTPSYGNGRAPLPRSVTANTAPSVSSTSSHDTVASEDLETIFKLRMMLFNEGETDTMSTTSSNSSGVVRPVQRKALPPQLVQRY